MQWDASPFAGFSTVESWLPVSTDFIDRNVAVQIKDPYSILNLYRKLFALRRHSPALSGGSYQPVEVGGDDIFAYLRKDLDEKQLVVLNFSGHAQQGNVSLGNGQILLSTHLDRQEIVSLRQVELRPYEGVIIKV
jgi:alpha-glucosidase